MEDIGLLKQVWKWLTSQKSMFMCTRVAVISMKDRIIDSADRYWPAICTWFITLTKILLRLLQKWRDSVMRGFCSLYSLGPSALFFIMWSFFLSFMPITSMVYVLLLMGAVGAAVRGLGYTPGLFIVGLFVILIMWMYGNFWLTGMLFIVGGYLFFLNHARVVIFISTVYAIYSVKSHAGWIGIFLSINFSFLSNDLFNHLVQGYDRVHESQHLDDQKEPDPVSEQFCKNFEHSSPKNETKEESCKTSSNVCNTTVPVNSEKESPFTRILKDDSSSLDEMKRILNCLDHYEALGLSRSDDIDISLLRKEYRKKAVLVHPDKNMGSPLASESFKKLQCAYEVLSDSTKRRDYDDQLLKEEQKSMCHRSCSMSSQDGMGFRSEESRRIQCTKCDNSHIWICTNRSKARARWCQTCCQYHPAKDGEGWVEFGCPMVFEINPKVEIPRAFVCAESKIFDVSEWAICQGMTCRPNTHGPSFHVKMVGFDKQQKPDASRFAWDFDAEMTDDEEEFKTWLQQALASGLFSDASKHRRMSWSPFKLPQKISRKQWRRRSP